MADPATLGLVISVAASVASALLAPKQPDTVTTGPRLGDTGVSSSAYGEAIPINYGTVRTGVNVIWAPDLVEVRTVTKTESGKGGGPTTTNTSFQYFLNAAVMVGEGVVGRWLRIWADNKLMYDGRANSQLFFKYPGGKLRFFDGTETQLPDALIEATEGVGNVPAHRGLAYFVVENMPVADFGNRVPQFSVEATWESGDTFPSRVLWTDAEKTANSDTGLIDGANPTFGAEDDIAFKHDEGLLWSLKTGQLTDLLTCTKIDLLASKIVAQRYMDAAGTAPFGDALTTGLSSPGMIVDDDFLIFTASTQTAGEHHYWRVDRNTFRPVARSALLVNGDAWADALEFQAVVSDSGRTDTFIFAATIDVVGSPPATVSIQGSFDSGQTFVFDDIPSQGGLTRIVALAGPDTNGDFWGLWDQSPGSGVGTIGLMRIPGLLKLSISRGTGGALIPPKVVQTFNLTNTLIGTPTGSAIARGLYLDDVSQELILAWQGASGTDTGIGRFDIASGAVLQVKTATALGIGSSAFDAHLHSAWRWARNQPATITLLIHDAPAADLHEIDFSDLTIKETHVLDTAEFNLPTSGFLSAVIPVSRDKSVVLRVDNSAPADVHQIDLNRGTQAQGDLADIVTNLASRVGLVAGDIDVTDLSGQAVRGFEITRRGAARSAVDRLSLGFFFDPVESDNKLKFVDRGKASSATIDFDDLGAALERLPDAPTRVDETRQQEIEVPMQIDLKYIAQERDYQAGDTYAKRMRATDPTVFGDELQKIELPVVFTAAEAEKVVDSVLAVAWTQRDRQEFMLPYRFVAVDPADNVTIQRPGCPNLLARVGGIGLGAGMVSEYRSVEEDLSIYSSLLTQAGGIGFIDQKLDFRGEARLFSLDLPLIKDGHSTGGATGPYLGASNQSGTFKGVVLHQSLDQLTWDQVDAFDAAVLGGIVINAGAAQPDPFVLDETTQLTVSPFNDASVAAFVSITDTQLFLEGNAAVWGNATDGYEIVKFKTVVVNGDGTLTLSTFIRGRRGTDREAVAGHSAGDCFLLLNPAGSDASWNRKTYAASTIGSTRFFRVTPIGNIFEAINFSSVVINGTDLKPYEAVHVADSRIGNDIRLTWVRQTRIGGQNDWNDGVADPPLGEDFERYDVALLVGPTPPAGFSTGDQHIFKTFNDVTTTSGNDFTAAQQSAAGYALSDPVNFRLYQISGTVGRGFPRNHTVPGV